MNKPAKVEMIEQSLKCFTMGLLGLLPLIGLPMAVQALFLYIKVKRSPCSDWNPAHRYHFWGGICVHLGLLVFVLSTWAAFTIVKDIVGETA
jgi:hypothetical protein